MEQRAVIRFLSLKGLKARDIQAELQSVYGPEACQLTAVKKWRTRFMQGRTDLFDDPRSGRPLTHDLAEAISSMLGERPFSSCKVLSRHFRIAKATCLRILHDKLGLKKFHLRWVPHSISSNQKSERVSYSNLLLAALEESRQTGFERLITGDESWFYISYPHESVWAASREDVPERLRQKIDTEKCLISILWSVNGIHSLLDIPKGMTYNTAFLCDTVIPSLIADITSRGRRKTLKGFMVHMDNAPAHNSRRSQERIEATKAKRLPHPAYSPDLAPSDFFLFGYLKEKLTDISCTNRDELKSAIVSLFEEIDKDVLTAVFESWITRVKWVIQKQGEYYHK
jgi:histone-lysine N-methyltransferase SETMAR